MTTTLTAAEAAAVARVDPGTVGRWVRDGIPSTRSRNGPRFRLPARRDGHAWLIDPADLDRFLAEFEATRERQADNASGVLAMPRTMASKLGDAAATYAARQTCPDACPFKAGGGCYAEYDNPRTHWDRVTRGAAGLSPLQVARNEAKAIDRLPGDRPLRLHVAGDSTTRAGTRAIAAACGRYLDRGHPPVRPAAVWAYTHSWQTVPRSDWGRVSILASCETSEGVRAAWGRGYAAAVAVPQFASDKAYDLGGVRVVPCPAQTRGVVCTDCGLCFDDRRLLERRLAIGFEVHGSGKAKAAETLRRVALPVVGTEVRVKQSA